MTPIQKARLAATLESHISYLTLARNESKATSKRINREIKTTEAQLTALLADDETRAAIQQMVLDEPKLAAWEAA